MLVTLILPLPPPSPVRLQIPGLFKIRYIGQNTVTTGAVSLRGWRADSCLLFAIAGGCWGRWR